MLGRPSTPVNQNDLSHYFEYSKSGLQVVEDGLKEVPFGEFMVEQGLVNRAQLFRALQMQDKYPGVRVGECAAALGYAQIGEVERLYDVWRGVATVEVA